MRKIRLLVLAAPALSLALIAGCKKETASSGGGPSPTPAQASTASSTMVRETYKGVSFDRPKDWKAEPSADADGLVVRAPDADLIVRVRPDPEGQDVAVALDEAATDLSNRKADFKLKGKRVEDHPNGFKYGRIDYTNTNEGVPFTQWEVIVPVDKNTRAFVQAVAATDAWDKVEPVFDQVLGSIKVEKGK